MRAGTRRPHDRADAQGVEIGEMDRDDLQLLVACLLGWVGIVLLAGGGAAMLVGGIRWLWEVLPWP